MKLENVQSQREQQPFALNFFLASKQESAEIQVFLEQQVNQNRMERCFCDVLIPKPAFEKRR